MPTVKPMAQLCEYLLPERALDNGVAQPRHLDPALVQQMSQEHARRSGPDDHDLGVHGCPLSALLTWRRPYCAARNCSTVS